MPGVVCGAHRERYYDRIYRLAWRFCGSQTTAEDIAQDVCIKIAAGIRDFRRQSAFSTWVWRITYTTTTDRLRSGQRIATIEPSRIVALVDGDALAHAPSAAEASDRTQYFRFGASSSFEGQKTAVPSGVSTTRREQLKLASPPQVLAGAHGDIEYTQEEEGNRDRFETAADYAVKQAAAEPVSTFSIDVDTASYAFMRRALNGGHLPPKDAVRVEEMINYFPYNYPRPESTEVPFQPTVTVVPAPWNPTNKLLHIGIKGYEPPFQPRSATAGHI